MTRRAEDLVRGRPDNTTNCIAYLDTRIEDANVGFGKVLSHYHESDSELVNALESHYLLYGYRVRVEKVRDPRGPVEIMLEIAWG
jgi:hypothetical protein